MTSREALEYFRALSINKLDKSWVEKCDVIKKDLDHLEKIIDILKDKLFVYESADYCLSVMGSKDYQRLTKQEYEILKEWLEKWWLEEELENDSN